jgi:hypothetical protein
MVAKPKNGASLIELTKYAICAGMDYVKNNGASKYVHVGLRPVVHKGN